MVYNFAGEREWIPKHDGGDIGEFLRISQYWVMYAEPPKSSVVTTIVGYSTTTTSNSNSEGEEEEQEQQYYVDVMLALKTKQWNNWKPGAPDDDDEALQTVVSPRWERALDQWGSRKDRTRATLLLQRLCHHDAVPESKSKQQPLQRLELTWKYYTIVLPGKPGRWKPSQTKDITLHVPCAR